MIRLVFSDLRDHVVTWIGAFIVAVGCGYIGGWVASLHTTAGFYSGDLYKSLQNAGSMMLVFSLVAGIAVLVAAANLTVSSQQRSYALWQLANVRPRLVGMVVLAQLAIVAALGAVCGTLLASVTFSVLFPWVFSARDAFAHVVPHVSVQLMPTVWFVVVGVFLLGGIKGARKAGMTPPLIALREPEQKRMGMTWLRVLLFALLVACVYWMYSIMADSTPYDALTWSILIPVLVVATLVPIAPLVFSMLLTVWTSLVPQKRWNAWYLARHTARYGLSISTSVETPIMVVFGLVSGLFSLMNVLAAYVRSQGDSAGGWSLDFSTTLVMLGGPVLLCSIGAAVSVVMSSRSRTRDVALLTAGGAQPTTLMVAAGCEAFIHTTNATLVGAASVVISNAIVAHVFGLPLSDGLSFDVGLIVSLVGFVLVLTATLVPTYAALKRETATVLAVRE